MFRLDGGRPVDERGFVHKRLIRAVGGAVGGFVSGGFGGAVRGAASGFVRSPTRPTAPRTETARPTIEGQQGKELGRYLKFGDAELAVSKFPLPAPRRITLNGVPTLPVGGGGNGGGSPCNAGESARCCRLRNGDFREQAQWQRECGVAGNGGGGGGGVSTPVGDAVMGRYGAALQPGVQTIERSVCLPGMHLANDGLCYNKGAITNKQRQWPRGRRPLLTGGDMRAIAIAARAGSKMERTTKRLRSLGMMKRLPPPRKAPAHKHALPVAAVSV